MPKQVMTIILYFIVLLLWGFGTGISVIAASKGAIVIGLLVFGFITYSLRVAISEINTR